ncbi:ribbon-helix-helix domain-containing protein [Rhizobium leguminosarum]|uniref:hypothetical protein n=1 Tax=Rhizobium leguminosarum TaxID=384 RepID=UPI0021BC14B2|nr:hypothetical protein [Rhizobium leguminosarum]
MLLSPYAPCQNSLRDRIAREGAYDNGPAPTSPRVLRNSSSIAFDDDVEEVLRDLSGEFGKTRNDIVRFIVREWMEKNTYLPAHALDEDGDVDGSA